MSSDPEAKHPTFPHQQNPASDPTASAISALSVRRAPARAAPSLVRLRACLIH